MTVETIENRINAANVPLDPYFVKIISKADDIEAEGFLDSYINDVFFRNFIITINNLEEKKVNGLATELEKIAGK